MNTMSKRRTIRESPNRSPVTKQERYQASPTNSVGIYCTVRKLTTRTGEDVVKVKVPGKDKLVNPYNYTSVILDECKELFGIPKVGMHTIRLIEDGGNNAMYLLSRWQHVDHGRVWLGEISLSKLKYDLKKRQHEDYLNREIMKICYYREIFAIASSTKGNVVIGSRTDGSIYVQSVREINIKTNQEKSILADTVRAFLTKPNSKVGLIEVLKEGQFMIANRLNGEISEESGFDEAEVYGEERLKFRDPVEEDSDLVEEDSDLVEKDIVAPGGEDDPEERPKAEHGDELEEGREGGSVELKEKFVFEEEDPEIRQADYENLLGMKFHNHVKEVIERIDKDRFDILNRANSALKSKISCS